MSNYIYIIKTAESIQKNDNVYKVGMTTAGPKNRIASYGSKSILISMIQVDCAETAEKIVLTELKKRFQQDKSYGIEYFKVDNIEEFIGLVLNICIKNCLSKNNSISMSIVNNIKEHKCVRCGHVFDRKSRLLSHYNREKICKPIELNVPITVLKEVINEPDDNVLKQVLRNMDENLYYKYIEKYSTNNNIVTHKYSNNNNLTRKTNILTCKFCNKEFRSYNSRVRHENKFCSYASNNNVVSNIENGESIVNDITNNVCNHLDNTHNIENSYIEQNIHENSDFSYTFNDKAIENILKVLVDDNPKKLLIELFRKALLS